MGEDHLAALIKKARASYDAMAPVERALHDADQRRSFVRGQSGRDPGPDVLAEEVRRLRGAVAETLAYKQKWSDDMTVKEKLSLLVYGTILPPKADETRTEPVLGDGSREGPK